MNQPIIPSVELEHGSLRVWSPDTAAQTAFAQAVVTVFSQYALEGAKPNETFAVEEHRDDGTVVVYFVHDRADA